MRQQSVSAIPRPVRLGVMHDFYAVSSFSSSGFVLTVHILWILGIVVLVVGLILAVLGATGREIGGSPTLLLV